MSRTPSTDDAHRRLLYLLLAADLLLITAGLLHAYTGIGAFAGSAFGLDRDRGYSEILIYAVELATASMLGFLAISRRSLLYLGWSALFIFFFLDDSLKIHEDWGARFAEHYQLAPHLHLRAYDFGEITVMAVITALILGFIALQYSRSSDAGGRAFSRKMILLILVLAVFGVGFDMADIIIDRKGGSFLGIIEDGGELVMMSVIAWVTAKDVRGRDRSTMGDA